MLNYILLIFGFFVAFFAFGFIFIETFFANLKTRLKFPLYFLSSILVSTCIVYIAGLIFGLTKNLVLIIFMTATFLFFTKLNKNILKLRKYLYINYKSVLLAALVFIIYLIALYPAIFAKHNNYFVMSGPNWQDTAMHLSITQSLTQGNFPPQAPYFSGESLSYYYFSDLHAAIISILADDFFPRVFSISNSLFAAILTISFYAFALEITNKRSTSLKVSLMGTFFSSFHWIKFLNDLSNDGRILEILSGKSYSMEYDQLFGMANFADYYLQNRPMMIGIPVFLMVTTLTIHALKNKGFGLIVLISLIVGMLTRFQFFTVMACCFSVFFLYFLNIKRIGLIRAFRHIVFFSVTVIGFYFLFGVKSVAGQSSLEIFRNNLVFETWDSEKSWFWHLKFLFMNLGFPLFFTMVSFIKSKNYYLRLCSLMSLVFISIPYLIRFTPAGGDMLKFFYFAASIFSLCSIVFLGEIIRNKYILNFVIIILVTFSTLSSFLTLIHSYLNKNQGYSQEMYLAGLWIRENTLKKSVFVTIPSIHSPPSDIGGRLRIISYTNWPYSHGFNSGNDNVFIRSDDVYNVYKTGNIDIVKNKYKAKYVYLGEEELGEFPQSKLVLEANMNLKKIYETGRTSIYEIF